MRLEDFVSETLAEIIKGVANAQGVAIEHKAQVNPYLGSSSRIQLIEFDVEVSTSEQTASGAKLGVFVGPVAAGLKGSSESTTGSVGRIKCKVPLAMPSHPAPLTTT